MTKLLSLSVWSIASESEQGELLKTSYASYFGEEFGIFSDGNTLVATEVVFVLLMCHIFNHLFQTNIQYLAKYTMSY